MKKRVKIIALATSLVLCLSLFAVGVLAATSATFNVTSTLNFKADGVYLMVDASLKQGTSVTDATLSNGENITENTYIGYSYPREANQDYPNGEASTSYFVNESGVQDNDWAIGQIDYSTENTVVVYEFIVSNYSPFTVSAKITTNLQTIISASNGQLSAATYKDSVQDSSPTYSFNIPARTNETTPGTITYQIAVTLNTFMSGFTTEQISMDFLFEEFVAPDVNYEYFNIQNNKITGLTSAYSSDAPETLVIPGYSETGEPLTMNYTESSSTISDPTNFDPYNILYGHGGEPGAGGGIIVPELGEPTLNINSNTKNIVFLYGITTIGNSAFEFCNNLESITIPSSVTRIGQRAFAFCSNLKNVFLPFSVKEIGYQAFEGCKNLTSITLSENLTKIGLSAFKDCSSLESIELPINYTELASGLFSGCTSLSSITHGNITKIGAQTFKNCSNLPNIQLTEGLSIIGNEAFYGCSKFNSITIPSSVEKIGDQAFENCDNMQIIVDDNNLNFSSVNGALYNKDKTYLIRVPQNATTFTLDGKVEVINNWAFTGCVNLESITIPSSIKCIGYKAFSNCTSLTEITIEALSIPVLNQSAFPDSLINIYVPTELVESYKDTETLDSSLNYTHWTNYSDIITAIV